MTFDSLAATYDATFGVSPVGRLFRFRLAERVMKKSPPPARILDIGCGTGEDGLWLAAQGYRVHGIDESSGMIEAASAKAAQAGSSATFECRSLQSLASGEPAYDLAISNFGALNCVSLESWTTILPRLLTSGGRGFVVLMGGKPLPEGARRGLAARDRGPSAEVRVGLSSVRVFYHSSADVRRSLSGTATVDRIEAMGCLVPGPGYDGFARRHPIALGMLAMGEWVLRSVPFFRDRGDHTLIEFGAR